MGSEWPTRTDPGRTLHASRDVRPSFSWSSISSADPTRPARSITIASFWHQTYSTKPRSSTLSSSGWTRSAQNPEDALEQLVTHLGGAERLRGARQGRRDRSQSDRRPGLAD